jgi:L-lysine 2,3-aminomutase
MRTLRGRLSGLCQPTYVLDIPGGHGKSPVGPNYVERVGSNGDAHVSWKTTTGGGTVTRG